MAIIDNIQIQLDLEAVRTRLHLKRDNDLKTLQDLAAIAQPLIEPKVLYKICYIEEKLAQGVIVEGLLLSSKVLRKNLDKIERIFPFVITIGSKFSEKLDACSDLLEKFYLDTIGNVALNQVRLELKNRLKAEYGIEKTAFMAPGSLPDWPLEEQKALSDTFQLVVVL